MPWQGECRRCLRPLDETLVVDVDERYAELPAEHDDAFPIEHGQIDLAPMVAEQFSWPSTTRGCAAPTAPTCARCAAPTSPPARAGATTPWSTSAGPPSTSSAPLSPIGVFAAIGVPCVEFSGSWHSDDTKHSDRVVGSAGEVGPVAWGSPNFVPETNDGRSQEEEVEVEDPQPSSWGLEARRPGAQRVPAVRRRRPHTVCPSCGWYKNRVAVDVA